jgi:hypothetical protein
VEIHICPNCDGVLSNSVAKVHVLGHTVCQHLECTRSGTNQIVTGTVRYVCVVLDSEPRAFYFIWLIVVFFRSGFRIDHGKPLWKISFPKHGVEEEIDKHQLAASKELYRKVLSDLMDYANRQPNNDNESISTIGQNSTIGM